MILMILCVDLFILISFLSSGSYLADNRHKKSIWQELTTNTRQPIISFQPSFYHSDKWWGGDPVSP